MKKPLRLPTSGLNPPVGAHLGPVQHSLAVTPVCGPHPTLAPQWHVPGRAGDRAGTQGLPPVPAPPRRRGKYQVTSTEVPGSPQRWQPPCRVTRARQWPGGLRGNVEGPRSAAMRPRP